jgi:hypothetical protein
MPGIRPRRYPTRSPWRIAAWRFFSRATWRWAPSVLRFEARTTAQGGGGLAGSAAGRFAWAMQSSWKLLPPRARSAASGGASRQSSTEKPVIAST